MLKLCIRYESTFTIRIQDSLVWLQQQFFMISCATEGVKANFSDNFSELRTKLRFKMGMVCKNVRFSDAKIVVPTSGRCVDVLIFVHS